MNQNIENSLNHWLEYAKQAAKDYVNDQKPLNGESAKAHYAIMRILTLEGQIAALEKTVEQYRELARKNGLSL